MKGQKEFDHDGSVTFALYTFMVFFHGAICESPAAAMESIIRSFVALFQGIVYFIQSFRQEEAFSRSLYQFREAFIYLCALPSLLLLFPGGLVYRRFDALEPWDVSTIWTIAGRVDPRRFAAFTFGQGSDATNVLSNRFPRDAMDDLPMPSAVSTSKYHRVSIGDGIPSKMKRSSSKRKKRKRGGRHQIGSSSSSGGSSSSDSSSESGSDSSYFTSDDDRDSSLREVVVELPVMHQAKRSKRNIQAGQLVRM
jgi:uncharacterized membrane protein YgcG